MLSQKTNVQGNVKSLWFKELFIADRVLSVGLMNTFFHYNFYCLYVAILSNTQFHILIHLSQVPSADIHRKNRDLDPDPETPGIRVQSSQFKWKKHKTEIK